MRQTAIGDDGAHRKADAGNEQRKRTQKEHTRFIVGGVLIGGRCF
jgi:hypothetical protein